MMRTHSRLRMRNGFAFSPLALFAAGEQGVWYDPNDLSTLFQDSAGTTPVTAAGQPVGLMLDKSGRGNHAVQPTAASRPILRQNATTGAYYLETDGVDDWMSTSAIDFTGTDKVSVFAGVRKLSDAATAVLMEISASSSSNNSTFGLFAPSSPGGTYAFRSKGNLDALATAGAANPSPDNAVLSGLGNISADSSVLRRNGVQIASNSADQGTGTYGNYPLYLFRRGGTTLPFSGHFYGMIIVGRLTTDIETRNSELMLANRTGVTLA